MKLRKGVFVVLALLLVLLLALPAAAVLQPTGEFYVNDYAGVLSGATKQYIMEKAPSLAKETGAQIVVLTVKSLEGKDKESYAREIARNWDIGDKDKKNGVLILLSTGDREVRVEVARGLEGALNDGKIGRLLDEYAVPYYKKNDFDTGTLELYKGVLSEVLNEYGLETLPGYEPMKDEEFPIGGMITTIIILVLVFGLLGSKGRGGRGGGGFIPPFIFFGPGNYRGPRGGGGFGGGDGGFGGGFGGGGFSGGGGGGGFSGGGGGRSF